MLKTEMRNEKTTHISSMTTEQMLKVMQEENMNAAAAVGAELVSIEAAVEGIYERMKEGGRLFYVGCGTSGRTGVIDAAECPPTYGVPHDRVVGIMAGGDKAMRTPAEGLEDNFESGHEELLKYQLTEKDSVVGISAAGGAAYVLGAFLAAKEAGAFTVAITSNAGSPVTQEAMVSICPDTGAEVVTGSTRMKAGTSQKMILNMISTSVMIKMGHVYENFMINLRPSNVKVRRRMCFIVSEIAGVSLEEAELLLKEHDFDLRKIIEVFRHKSEGMGQ